jgi:hypothetical protein
MCCFLAALLFFGPRLAVLVWWLFQPARMMAAFNGSWLWPILGLIFLPWTLLMYLIVFPGGVVGFDWIILGLGLLADIAGYTGGYRERRSVPYYPQ